VPLLKDTFRYIRQYSEELLHCDSEDVHGTKHCTMTQVEREGKLFVDICDTCRKFDEEERLVMIKREENAITTMTNMFEKIYELNPDTEVSEQQLVNEFIEIIHKIDFDPLNPSHVRQWIVFDDPLGKIARKRLEGSNILSVNA